MARIEINKEKCKGCLLCVHICPRGIIQSSEKELNKKGTRVVKFKDGAECTGCSMCAIICPDAAIEVYKDE